MSFTAIFKEAPLIRYTLHSKIVAGSPQQLPALLSLDSLYISVFSPQQAASMCDFEHQTWEQHNTQALCYLSGH